NEIEKSIEFDWSPYVTIDTIKSNVEKIASPLKEPEVQEEVDEKTSRPDSYFESPIAGDFGEPELPERAECTTYRIVRDTKKALWVKNVHKFRCQICNETI